MQIGTQNVPFWEFGCGELETGAQTGEIDPVEDFFPLVEAMLPGAPIQGAEVVQMLWMAVGSVEDESFLRASVNLARGENYLRHHVAAG
jgi:hypothetical protein